METTLHKSIVEFADSAYALFQIISHNFNYTATFVFVVLGVCCSFMSEKTLILYRKLLISIQTGILKRGVCYTTYLWRVFKGIISGIWDKLKDKTVKINVKRMPKGLVGVIAVDINSVSNTKIESNNIGFNEIYFADPNGDYYNRNTNLTDEEIKSQCGIISTHYDEIKNEIDKKYKDNSLFLYEDNIAGDVIKKTHICDKFFELYSFDNIKRYIDKVNADKKENNAIHFIGDKIGVKSFTIQDKNLQLDIYKTDHFTWQVFKEIFKDNKPFFQELILRVNRATQEEQQILVKCLAFLFSSFGVDIIIESVDCQQNRNLIIAARSGKIEKNKTSSLHVSVNETFSRTDNIGEADNNYDLLACVKRGIQEELGIPEERIKDDYIQFQDFAIVTDEGEIGLSCYVNLAKEMTTEQLLLYPGQDKFLENEELLILPYFKINHISLLKAAESSKFRHKFFTCTHGDRFNMPWMSFTPLLISRALIRNVWSCGTELYVYQFVSQTIYYLLLCCLLHTTQYISLAYILEQFIGYVSGLFILYGLINPIRTRFFKKGNYKYIQPIVSQWYGNAKVVQATGMHNSDIGKNFEIKVDDSVFSDNDNIVDLSSLELREAPYCAVRIKRNKFSYAEKPISRYFLQKSNTAIVKNHLNFFLINSYIDSSSGEICVFVKFFIESVDNVKKIKTISFVHELRNMQVVKNKDGNPDYSLSLDNYEPLDLFSYQDNYYWSCEAAPKVVVELVKPDMELEMNCKGASVIKDFYSYVSEKCAKSQKEIFVVSVKGPKNMVEYWLNSFVNHPRNKRRISELELYMLQFYFIRKKIIFADCEYYKKIRTELGVVSPQE